MQDVKCTGDWIYMYNVVLLERNVTVVRIFFSALIIFIRTYCIIRGCKVMSEAMSL